MQYLFRASGTAGYEQVIGHNSGLRFFSGFGILRLSGSEAFEGDTGPGEAILHLVEGQGVVRAGSSESHLGARPTPFDGPPAALYLPPGTRYSVTGDGLEMVISHAPAESCGPPKVVQPQNLAPSAVGRDNWQRVVTMVAPPGSFCQALVVGETLNPSGNWSGVPAHKHDGHGSPEESIQEEIYYFRFRRPGDWGILRIYDNNRLDELLLLKDRSVTLIPRGYHTVAAAPGSEMFYTFHLAGPQKELIVSQDPDQAWIAQANERAGRR